MQVEVCKSRVYRQRTFCGAICTVHDVAQDLCGHDNHLRVHVQRGIAGLEADCLVPKSLPELTQLLVAERFERSCVDDPLAPAHVCIQSGHRAFADENHEVQICQAEERCADAGTTKGGCGGGRSHILK